MRRFWLALYLGTAIIHLPFVVALHEALARLGAPWPWALSAAASLALALALRGRLRLLRSDRPISPLRLVLVEEPYFAHWCACVAAVPLAAVFGVVAALHALIAPAGWPRPSAGLVVLAAYAAALALATWGVFVRRRWVRVREIDVRVPGLGPRFDGFRIAQLSDLHIGSMCPRARGERWAAIVNRLEVDLIALTGDYVTSGVAFHHDIAEVLGAMRAKDGVYAVMGNHDYFGDGEPLVSLLEARGVKVLRNGHASLRRGTEDVVVAGVDDTWTRRANVKKAFDGVGAGAAVICLAHDPMLFPIVQKQHDGPSLVLSGHTHWGQIAVPFLARRFNLSARRYRYNAGRYEDGKSTLWVSPGLGTTGPPVRLGAAPEITVLRLRAA